MLACCSNYKSLNCDHKNYLKKIVMRTLVKKKILKKIIYELTQLLSQLIEMIDYE